MAMPHRGTVGARAPLADRTSRRAAMKTRAPRKIASASQRVVPELVDGRSVSRIDVEPLRDRPPSLHSTSRNSTRAISARVACTSADYLDAAVETGRDAVPLVDDSSRTGRAARRLRSLRCRCLRSKILELQSFSIVHARARSSVLIATALVMRSLDLGFERRWPQTPAIVAVRARSLRAGLIDKLFGRSAKRLTTATSTSREAPDRRSVVRRPAAQLEYADRGSSRLPQNAPADAADVATAPRTPS